MNKQTEITITIKEIFEIYKWGISEGQVIMEEERETEELFDAAVCFHGSRKYCIPNAPVRRRQLHSEKWFTAMQNDKNAFIDFVAQKLKEGSV